MVGKRARFTSKRLVALVERQRDKIDPLDLSKSPPKTGFILRLKGTEGAGQDVFHDLIRFSLLLRLG